MRISNKILVKGIDNEVLEYGVSYVLESFRIDNPEMDIEKASPIVKVVMESAGDEREFKISEDENNIRLEVIGE